MKYLVFVNCADVKDFVPAPLEGDTYEGFETLVEKANCWLADLSGIVHISLQSVLVQKGDRKSASFFLLHNKMSSLSPVAFFLQLA